MQIIVVIFVIARNYVQDKSNCNNMLLIIQQN
jgi:hypothetical protein